MEISLPCILMCLSDWAIRPTRAYVCVPFWNMCHPETCFRLACCTCRFEKCFFFFFFFFYSPVRFEKCSFLKHVSDWHPANFVISRADHNMSFLTITFEVALLLLLKNKQTKKEMQPDLTFGLFSLTFMLQDHEFIMPLRYDEVKHSANLKHASEMHIFQNGIPCQSETCFRMAHVFRTARNTYSAWRWWRNERPMKYIQKPCNSPRQHKNLVKCHNFSKLWHKFFYA